MRRCSRFFFCFVVVVVNNDNDDDDDDDDDDNDDDDDDDSRLVRAISFTKLKLQGHKVFFFHYRCLPVRRRKETLASQNHKNKDLKIFFTIL